MTEFPDRNDGGGRRALLVGCGIAGPVLSLFLKRIGFQPSLFEAQPASSPETGSFLSLAANGAHVLDVLGVRDTVLAHGVSTTRIVYHNHRGKVLGELAATSTLIKRAQLVRGLLTAAQRAGVRAEFGKRLVGIDAAVGEVVARFEDGSTARGDLLVGCDGVHSAARQAILRDGPRPRYTGVIDSGGFVRTMPLAPTNATFHLTFGRRGFFGYQVAPGGEVYWFANLRRRKEPDRAWRPGVANVANATWQRTLVDLYGHDPPPIADILTASDGPIAPWPLYEVPSLPRWHAGSACLIGDAAHATSPRSEQGAALAMEDAMMLSLCLRDSVDIPAAFARFDALRREPVERLRREEQRTGRRQTASNPLSRVLRDLVLPFSVRRRVESAQRTYAYRMRWDQDVA